MKFASGLSNDLVLECQEAKLNNDMDISIIIVYIQQVEKEKNQAGEEKM